MGQTYTITLGFIESPGAFVFPGASVTVYARTKEQNAEGAILPEGALVFDEAGDPAVMVYKEGVVRRTPVGVELLADGRLTMIDGPAMGTRIVMTGASQLRDGQAVRPYTRIGE
jgi:multidrug efflux pump subunit AcrA (membrane-fusion protein)